MRDKHAELLARLGYEPSGCPICLAPIDLDRGHVVRCLFEQIMEETKRYAQQTVFERPKRWILEFEEGVSER